MFLRLTLLHKRVIPAYFILVLHASIILAVNRIIFPWKKAEWRKFLFFSRWDEKWEFSHAPAEISRSKGRFSARGQSHGGLHVILSSGDSRGMREDEKRKLGNVRWQSHDWLSGRVAALTHVGSRRRVGNGLCEAGFFAHVWNRLTGRRRTKSAVTLP